MEQTSHRSRAPAESCVSQAYFPRASTWLQNREPEKARLMKELWHDYRRVRNNRCMRLERGQVTRDLDEKAQKLTREAWLIRNALLEDAQEDIADVEDEQEETMPTEGELGEESCPEAEPVKPTPKEPDYLYVLQNPLIPGILKIGRATCPVRRARELSTCQPFELVVCSSYVGWGFLERILHAKLKHKRVEGGRGQEWFSVEPWQVDILVKAAIVEFELAT
jgi:hypothetical protein